MKRFLLITALIASVFFLFISKNNKHYPQPKSKDTKQEPPVESVYKTSVTTAPYLTNIYRVGLNNDAGAIECIAISKTDSNLMLAGGAQGGLFRTTNRGVTWSPVNDFAPSLQMTCIAQNQLRTNEFYFSTGVDLYNNGVLVNDIYKSTDNGLTFNNITATGTFPFGKVNKIVCSPLDSNTIYFMNMKSASGTGTLNGSLYRTKDNFATYHKVFQSSGTLNDVIILPNGHVMTTELDKIYISHSGDSGTYVQSNNGIASNITRMLLGACTTQPLTRYAVGTTIGQNFICYKSIDAGINWTAIGNPVTAFPRTFTVKPDDPNVLIAGCVRLLASTNSGLTWENIGGGYDNREVLFDPNNYNQLFITSDFGVSSVEVNTSSATPFAFPVALDTNLNVQEIHGGDYGITGNACINGYQDIGVFYIKNNGLSKYLSSADGMYGQLSRQDSTLGYFCIQNGVLKRDTNLYHPAFNAAYIMNEMDTNGSLGIDEGAAVITQFFLNQTNDQQLFFPSRRHLWRSDNGGDNWIQLSGNYYNTNARVFIAGSSKPDPIIYWCDYDTIFVMPNAGTAAPGSEFRIRSPFTTPVSICIDPQNDSSIYILQNNPSKIYHAVNMFASTVTWTDIGMNFPANVNIRCIAVHPTNSQIILAGTNEGGLYYTTDGGLTWNLESNFPYVRTLSIKIRPTDNKIFIFTYGRGTWTADFPVVSSINEAPVSFANIYPNPFKDVLYIENDATVKNADVYLMTITGAIIRREEMYSSSASFNYSEISPGIYYIVIMQDGKVLDKRKVVKTT